MESFYLRVPQSLIVYGFPSLCLRAFVPIHTYIDRRVVYFSITQCLRNDSGRPHAVPCARKIIDSIYTRWHDITSSHVTLAAPSAL